MELHFRDGSQQTGKLQKHSGEKKPTGKLVFPCPFIPGGYSLSVHTGKLFLLFPVGILHFPVGMFTLREIRVSSSERI